MPSLSEHQSSQRAKILVVGDSGSGKTGALACLANAGMRLFILDYDDGLDVLKRLVKPEFHSNVTFETLRDRVVGSPKGPVVKGMPTAFARGLQLLDKWGEFGSVDTWGPNDVLVIDTLTHMGAAALWYTLYVNNRLGKRKRFQDWGAAMERQEGVLQQLTATEIKCNVVVNAHLTWLGDDSNGEEDDEEGAEPGAPRPAPAVRKTVDYKRYPSALGKKLPPRIATYFNAVVQARVVGAGPNARRVIRTVPEADVDIKVPLLPGDLPNELPLSDGLLRIMRAIRGEPKVEK